MKPFSESCEQNKAPILAILEKEISPQHHSLLEIGSGTGQHAVYFAAEFPHVSWQPSDQEQNLAGIKLWIQDCKSGNLLQPLVLDTQDSWPDSNYDLVFSANTAHIMSWPAVCAMFSGVEDCLHPDGKMILYGPFNYDGKYTSASNAQFDQWLKQRDPDSGIRDVSDLSKLAKKHGMCLAKDYEMPANNRILVWQRG